MVAAVLSARAKASIHLVYVSMQTKTNYSPPGPFGRNLVSRLMHQVARWEDVLAGCMKVQGGFKLVYSPFALVLLLHIYAYSLAAFSANNTLLITIHANGRPLANPAIALGFK